MLSGAMAAQLLHHLRPADSFRLMHWNAEPQRGFLDWRHRVLLAAPFGPVGLSEHSDNVMSGRNGAF